MKRRTDNFHRRAGVRARPSKGTAGNPKVVVSFGLIIQSIAKELG